MNLFKRILKSGNGVFLVFQNMFSLSHSSAFDELKEMMDHEVIEAKGKGRSTHYVLVT